VSSCVENPISPKMILSNEETSAAAATESDHEVGEESRVPKVKRSPGEPTNEEILLHEVTHTPYRSWCPCCVAGRGGQIPI